jgi:hypothetical protein
VQVRVTCECGHRQATITCSENSYARMTTALLATRMADVQAGNTVDLKVCQALTGQGFPEVGQGRP